MYHFLSMLADNLNGKMLLIKNEEQNHRQLHNWILKQQKKPPHFSDAVDERVACSCCCVYCVRTSIHYLDTANQVHHCKSDLVSLYL